MQFFKKEFKKTNTNDSISEKFKKTKNKISLFFKKALLTLAISNSLFLQNSCFNESDSLHFSLNNQPKKPAAIPAYKQQRIALYDTVNKKYYVVDTNITKLATIQDSMQVAVIKIEDNLLFALLAINTGSGWNVEKVLRGKSINGYFIFGLEANNGEEKAAHVGLTFGKDTICFNKDQIGKIGKNNYSAYFASNYKLGSSNMALDIKDIFAGELYYNLVNQNGVWKVCPYTPDNKYAIVSTGYNVKNILAKLTISGFINDQSFGEKIEVLSGVPTKVRIKVGQDELSFVLNFTALVTNADLTKNYRTYGADYTEKGTKTGIEDYSYFTSFFIGIENVELNGNKLFPKQQTNQIKKNSSIGFNYANQKDSFIITISLN